MILIFTSTKYGLGRDTVSQSSRSGGHRGRSWSGDVTSLAAGK
jgi:hypothetical protein